MAMNFNGEGACIWRSQELGNVKGGKKYRKGILRIQLVQYWHVEGKVSTLYQG